MTTNAADGRHCFVKDELSGVQIGPVNIVSESAIPIVPLINISRDRPRGVSLVVAMVQG